MPMDNLVDFDMKVFDMHYLLFENIKFHEHNTFYKVFASFYRINYVFKVAKLNITKQYLRWKHQWAKKTINIYALIKHKLN